MTRWGFTFPIDGLPLHAHRDVLREAEQLGYTDAWTYEIDGVDCFTPLALAGVWTEKLMLGTAIANVFTRGPLTLAMSAMSVAEAAPGRFCFGIGAGSPAIVENWNGTSFDRPYGKVRDVAMLLKQALAGERVTQILETANVRGMRLSRRLVPPPPLYIAALRKNMLALAGEVADGAIINWLSASDVPRCVAAARSGAVAAGRDPEAVDIVCRIFVCVSEDAAAVNLLGRYAIAAYLTVPAYSKFHAWLGRGEALRPMTEAWRAGDRKAALEAVPQQVVDDLIVSGDAETCRRKIQHYIDAGVRVPVINFMPTTTDPAGRAEQSLAMLRALAPR
jgi:probable F420-dependent oxidoreductase